MTKRASSGPSSHGQDAIAHEVPQGTNAARAVPLRPRSLGLDLRGGRRRASLYKRARQACGLSQEAFAARVGLGSRNVLAKHESPHDDAEPTVRFLELVPDEYLDIVQAELAAVRVARGFGRRVWMTAPTVEHACDDVRARALTLVLFEVLRGRPQQVDHQTLADRCRAALRALQESLAFHIQEGAR